MLVDPQLSIAYRHASVRRDLALAIAVAAVLTIAWTISDWASLRWLVLPDTDDMARLAQVRDWLNGQAFDDWTQYRLGPPGGAPMHWSRINDIGIAGLILAGRQIASPTNAEIGAVIVYPASLFAVSLFLAARSARHLWRASEAGPIAIILTAFAYPGNALFLPGRIDHHALQIVCLAIAILTLVGPVTWQRGAAAGVALGISLGIGLETLPQTVAIIAVSGLLWIAGGPGQNARLGSLGAALGITTLMLLITMRPTLWSAAYCDTFTPASTSATLAGAGVLIVCSGYSRWLPSARSRLLVSGLAATIVIGASLWAYPSCIDGPYGEMDPFLRHAMIDNITEALPIFGPRPWIESFALGGVMFTACIVSIWAWFRFPARRAQFAPVGAVIGSSAAVALFQARGANFGAAFAPLALTAMVIAARRRSNTLAMIGAWVAACGMIWLTIPAAIARIVAEVGHTSRPSASATAQIRQSCRTEPAFAAIGRLPRGAIMASIDLSPYLLAATKDRVIGSSYHRNNAGNRALYAFFLSPPERSLSIARHWRATYVAACPADFAELGVPDRFSDSLAAALARGKPPAWLKPMSVPGSALRFYRID